MGKNFKEETKRKAEAALLKAERDLIYLQDLRKNFESEDAIVPNHIDKEIMDKTEKAQKAVKRAKDYLKKVNGTRIDPSSIPSKMEEKEAAIKELNKSTEKRKIELDVTEHEKYSGPISRTREATHNLKEVIPTLSKEIKFQNIGFGGEKEYSDFVARGTYNKILFDPKDGTRDPEIVESYYKRLEDNKLTPNPYFTEMDGEIYYLIKNFFEAKQDKNNRDFGMSLAYLQGFCNTLVWYVANIEKSGENNDIRRAYLSGRKIKVMPRLDSPVKFSIFGKGWNRNPLKEAAWIVVHSYLINILLNESDQYKLIPKNKELVPMWNNYISMMDDVPDLVKKYYYLNDDGESIFTRSLKKSIAADIATERDLKTSHPVDDHEEGATVPFEEAIVVDTTGITSSVEELKANFKNSIKEDNVIDAEFKLVPANIDNNKKENQQDNKNEATKNVEAKEENIPKKEDKKVDDASAVKPISRPIESDPTIDQNNRDTEQFIPKLNRFTDLARKNGYSVFYGSKPTVFPGMAIAILINRENSEEKRVLLLDPCLVYGDTLRVININNNLQNVDLKRCAFVAISQKEAVEKLIKGTFDKEDRKKNNEQLPRVLNDFRDPYHFIDRVDLSNLQEITKKPDGKSISFNEWKKLVINISNILKNSSIPVCRFRVCEYINCNKFKLICDDQVKIFHISNINHEPSQAQAFAQKFWVDYDPEKYGDANYAFGVMNNNVA